MFDLIVLINSLVFLIIVYQTKNEQVSMSYFYSCARVSDNTHDVRRTGYNMMY